MRRITRASDDLQREIRRLLHVNELDFHAMEHLISEGRLTPGELARRLGISAALASVVVDRLEGVGHAERTRDAADRRRVVVEPAAESVREAMAHLLPMIRETDAAFASLSPEEQRGVVRFLEATLASMERQLAELHETPVPQRRATSDD